MAGSQPWCKRVQNCHIPDNFEIGVLCSTWYVWQFKYILLRKLYMLQFCHFLKYSNWSINKSISHLSLLLFTFGEYLNFRQDSIQNVSKFLVFWRLFLKWVKPKNNRQCHFLSHCGLVTLNSLKSQKKVHNIIKCQTSNVK